jgi:ATP-dependent DNA helicase DinG
VIPDTEVAVVDEAHQLEDVVTMYFGVTVGTHRVEELVHDASRAAGLAFVDDHDLGMKVANAVSDAQHECRRLFDAVRAEVREQCQGGDRLTLSPAALENLQAAGSPAIESLERLAGAVKTAQEAPQDLVAIAARAAGLADELKVVLRAGDPAYVHFAEVRGRGVTLRAAPIDVSAIVRRAIVGDRLATVLTSATLAVEGRFDYVQARLGLSDAATLRLPSEFDFKSQAVLFLPVEMPDPRSPEFNRAAAWMIGELVDRTRGRAFVLFTSHQAMRDVHAMLERRIGWPLLVQGTAPRSALLRDFRNTPNAVLLATASFWQGVDVAGEQLSCVIIDRLPFASPADPLVAARIRAIAERGGHPFHEYQVPLATLTLLQGLGRLIRTRADRGVLAVLDPRLQRMSYGQRFLGSLPPAPVTEDLAVVARFFGEPETVV